ncbi:MAG: phage scaffolding protein [Methanimicrococcus sp.]|nr:phage scaffolding protein [Methanimicrococcus sp.]
MDLKKLTELGLDETTAKKVLDEISNEKGEKGYVPLERLNEEIEKKKALEGTKAELEKWIKEREKYDSDTENLQKQIAELKSQNAKDAKKREDAEKAHAAEMRKMKRDSIDERVLTESKARNKTAVKALLAEIGEDADDENYETERKKQIKDLTEKEDSKFLFGEDVGNGGFKPFRPDGSKKETDIEHNRGLMAAKRINQEKFPTKQE